MSYTTYQYRVKDSTSKKHLNKMAGAINFVWNYCNEVSHRSITYNRKWLSGYDLQNLTSGTSEDMKLSAQSIQMVCQEYAMKRKQFRKIKLRWRSSKRSLGWIPITNQNLKYKEPGKVKFGGYTFRFWESRPFPEKIKSGSFSQDSRGRWYLNVVAEVEEIKSIGDSQIGVDLGLKTTATYSDGNKFEGVSAYRNLEQKLAIAQRANKKKLVRTIHAKIANVRKDSLHKETTRVVNTYNTIFVGDVSSLKLAKTKMAKSVLDSGWGMYRSMLAYKAIRLGKEVVEVKENFSTVTCSVCFERSGPSGLSALGVREWTCTCGASHNRDVNAAKNILRFGHESLKGVKQLAA